MLGKVFIEDMALQCHIGVTTQEKEKRQEILVSIYMDIDPKLPAQTDNLTDTINYSQLHSRLLQIAETLQFNLLETLATQIADHCLHDPHVTKVKVIAKKPHIYQDTKAVGVVIEKEK